MNQERDKYRQYLEPLLAERTAEWEAANQRIRLSEERYDFALAATHDGIWDWDIPSKTAYCSPAYFSMLGYAPGELSNPIEEHWLNLLHPDERHWVAAEAHRRLQQEGGYTMEFRMRTKSGDYKWVLSRVKVVAHDEQGRPLRAVGTLTDVSSQKALELELRAAKEQAETSNRIKSSILANLSHEIRTPIDAILDLSSVLQGELTDASQQQKLNTIILAAKQLIDLSNDILYLSEIEAGQIGDLPTTPIHSPSLCRLLGQSMTETSHFANMAAIGCQHDAPNPLQILNSEKGLSNLGSALDSYQRLLKQFIAMHSNDSTRINDAFRSGDMKAAHRIAHTLKGVSATLGIEQLHEQAFKLDQLLKAGAELDAMLPEVASLDERLLQALPVLKAFVTQAASSERPAEMDFSILSPLLHTLNEQLAKDNIKSIDTWRTLTPLLVKLLGEDAIATLDQQIAHYDLPAAFSSLQSLIEAYPHYLKCG